MVFADGGTSFFIRRAVYLNASGLCVQWSETRMRERKIRSESIKMIFLLFTIIYPKINKTVVKTISPRQ